MTDKEQYQELHDQVRQVLYKVDALIRKVDSIDIALIGNEYNKEAVIPAIAEIRKDVNELKDFKKSMKWTAAGLVVGIGYTGFKGIQALIKILFP